MNNDINGRLKHALDNVTENGLRDLFAFNGIDHTKSGRDTMSHQLIHIDTDDFVTQHLTFASDYVWDNLNRRFHNLLIDKAEELACAGEENSEFGCVSGLIFERRVHQVMCAWRKSVRARILTVKGGFASTLSGHVEIALQEITGRAVFSDLSELERMKPGIYYRPRSRRFPAIDSLVLLHERLYLFQMTIAEHHGVQSDDLARVLDRVNAYKQAYLVFVTHPAKSGTYRAQNYLTKQRRIAKRVNEKVEKLSQLVFGVGPRMFAAARDKV